MEGLIIYIQHNLRNENKGRNKSRSSGSVPIEKHKKVLEERDKYRLAYEQLNAKYNKKGSKEHDELLRKYLQVDEAYKKSSLEIFRLKQELEKLNRDKKSLEQDKRDLTRDNDELNKLVGNEPAPSFAAIPKPSIQTPDMSKSALNESSSVDVHANSSQSPVQDSVSTESESNKYGAEDDSRGGTSTEITMYASFPRTAGSSIYFSDLSENRGDDSYFELKISVIYGKATFKPIDFMKIRNYDPAMAAMLTEGVKPNVASTVLGIEPGKAHIEGKDWIIDKPAKIKLA
jgi:hypothetical protein